MLVLIEVPSGNSPEGLRKITKNVRLSVVPADTSRNSSVEHSFSTCLVGNTSAATLKGKNEKPRDHSFAVYRKSPNKFYQWENQKKSIIDKFNI
jgi:hypothetical protein